MLNKKNNIIIVISIVVIIITLFSLFFIFNKDKKNKYTENNNINLLDFFSSDDYEIIRMLINGQDEKGMSIVNHSKFYIFNYIFNGNDKNKLSDEEREFTKCIKDFSKKGRIDSEYYNLNIKDDFLKGICLGEDKELDGDNLKKLRDISVIQLTSKGKESKNICNNIPREKQSLDYFLCIGLAFNDFNKVNHLMNLYVNGDFMTGSYRCENLKTEDKYLYNTCKSYEKIWSRK